MSTLGYAIAPGVWLVLRLDAEGNIVDSRHVYAAPRGDV